MVVIVLKIQLFYNQYLTIYGKFISSIYQQPARRESQFYDVYEKPLNYEFETGNSCFSQDTKNSPHQMNTHNSHQMQAVVNQSKNPLQAAEALFNFPSRFFPIYKTAR